MDNNTLAIVIAISASAVGVIVAIAVAIYANSKQGSRHYADIAALRAEFNAKFDNLRTELLTEIRELGYRIENRINLDERVRTVEQRTAPSPDDAPAD